MSETYHAFDDPATGSGEDSWALAIAHAQRGNKNNVTVDLLREWRPPFSAEAVIKEICDLCRSYRCYKITSDRTGKWTDERFTQWGGVSREITAKNKNDIYVGVTFLLSHMKTELFDLGHATASITQFIARCTSLLLAGQPRQCRASMDSTSAMKAMRAAGVSVAAACTICRRWSPSKLIISVPPPVPSLDPVVQPTQGLDYLRSSSPTSSIVAALS